LRIREHGVDIGPARVTAPALFAGGCASRDHQGLGYPVAVRLFAPFVAQISK